MNRRRFAFWIGMGLFGAAERLQAESLDNLAAALMSASDSPPPVPSPTLAEGDSAPPMPVHWQVTHNNTWRWVQREEYLDGHWRLTGMTTPVHRHTGEPLEDGAGYLGAADVPERFRLSEESRSASIEEPTDEPATDEPLGDPYEEDSVRAAEESPGPDAVANRRARHGRPPSRWLRSLSAGELSVWLASLDPPEATVEGMSFAEHLTRDHGFSEAPVAGLTELEQAKLHGAAHHGY